MVACTRIASTSNLKIAAKFNRSTNCPIDKGRMWSPSVREGPDITAKPQLVVLPRRGSPPLLQEVLRKSQHRGEETQNPLYRVRAWENS